MRFLIDFILLKSQGYVALYFSTTYKADSVKQNGWRSNHIALDLMSKSNYIQNISPRFWYAKQTIRPSPLHETYTKTTQSCSHHIPDSTSSWGKRQSCYTLWYESTTNEANIATTLQSLDDALSSRSLSVNNVWRVKPHCKSQWISEALGRCL